MKDWQQRLMGKAMTVMCWERIQIKEIHGTKTNKNNTPGGGGGGALPYKPIWDMPFFRYHFSA